MLGVQVSRGDRRMNPALITYGALGIAIMFEIIGTTLLQQSQQFTRWLPTLGMALCYGAAFYFLSIALKTIPVGVAYAIWSGMGIVLIALIGLMLFGQKLDLPAIIGMAMIIGGVVVMNLFSKTVSH
ncbi:MULTISPECIES: DMT family transporter [Hyphomonas]|nr:MULTISPECIES: multidrug efflux SMR transporter [Hyphomonas]